MKNWEQVCPTLTSTLVPKSANVVLWYDNPHGIGNMNGRNTYSRIRNRRRNEIRFHNPR